MHPAEQVAIASQHQTIGVVTHPDGYTLSQGRPLIGAALGKALNLQGTVIQLELTMAVFRLAEAGAGYSGVDGRTVDHKGGLHVVKITVAPRPEMQTADGLFGSKGGGASRSHHDGLAAEVSHLLTILVTQLNFINNLLILRTFVLDLTLGMNEGFTTLDIVILSVDIHARRA